MVLPLDKLPPGTTRLRVTVYRPTDVARPKAIWIRFKAAEPRASIYAAQGHATKRAWYPRAAPREPPLAAGMVVPARPTTECPPAPCGRCVRAQRAEARPHLARRGSAALT